MCRVSPLLLVMGFFGSLCPRQRDSRGLLFYERGVLCHSFSSSTTAGYDLYAAMMQCGDLLAYAVKKEVA